MKNLWKIAALTSAVLFSTGCATIVSKSSYPVNIKSTPSGASYVIKNRAGVEVKQGVTPDVVTLEAGAGYFKGEKYQITFTLPKSSKQKTVELDTSLDGWYLGGNLLFGGLLGYLVIDPLTGAMYKLPEELNADLTSNEHTLNIISLDSLTTAQKAKLQPINL
jgi:hypothetical protein